MGGGVAVSGSDARQGGLGRCQSARLARGAAALGSGPRPLLPCGQVVPWVRGVSPPSPLGSTLRSQLGAAPLQTQTLPTRLCPADAIPPHPPPLVQHNAQVLGRKGPRPNPRTYCALAPNPLVP